MKFVSTKYARLGNLIIQEHSTYFLLHRTIYVTILLQ
jgi:hypothetical protein